MDRREVGLVVGTTTERRDDVVNAVRTGLLADVADASVAPQNACAKALPVRRQRCGAVSGHTRIVPRRRAPR